MCDSAISLSGVFFSDFLFVFELWAFVSILVIPFNSHGFQSISSKFLLDIRNERVFTLYCRIIDFILSLLTICV